MQAAALSVFVVVSLVAVARAEVPLAPLWPNADGTHWEYEMHVTDLREDIDVDFDASLALEGTTTTPGGEAQNLIAVQQTSATDRAHTHPNLPPILLAVWRGRPDLREALEARSEGADAGGGWDPIFLHGGYLMKSTSNVQMWQNDWTHPTWTYLEAPVTVGHSFVHQLVPEFTDDVFLHGTVVAVDAEVTTPAGIFSGAVKLHYLVDLGVANLTDEGGVWVGTTHAEYRGSVHYVPGVGPVDLLEELTPYVWADCPNGCPPEVEDYVGVVTLTVTMVLAAPPTGVRPDSWGSVKALYR